MTYDKQLKVLIAHFKKGKSKRNAAKLAGVSRQTVIDMCAERKETRPSTVNKIYEALFK